MLADATKSDSAAILPTRLSVTQTMGASTATLLEVAFGSSIEFEMTVAAASPSLERTCSALLSNSARHSITCAAGAASAGSSGAAPSAGVSWRLCSRSHFMKSPWVEGGVAA
eukprot:6163729-Pleurochrysis_carterae.AAC.3